ncbi:hypothetical protein [Cytobacillus sp. IB215665]|uniref:hypothetical protein n=1 Tax=Cytobacillus sp. IB215665 TaxID=3097357 RepID=UPI002A12DFEE|nr:hypothetical protein [Cytobacillus sp. IB215665]MDX8367687.1 hypothetical protein [Cytobacillus sp. IB215665]
MKQTKKSKIQQSTLMQRYRKLVHQFDTGKLNKKQFTEKIQELVIDHNENTNKGDL